MFGGDLIPPVHKKHQKNPIPHDIQMPCLGQINCYAHRARQPNTDYHVQLLHYKQRAQYANIAAMEADSRKLANDKITVKYDKHFERKQLKREIASRVAAKMTEYEEAIERRREKLREILDVEEREYYKEVVDQAQRGGETRMYENKRRITELKAKREAERQEIVEQKRIQQYMMRCQDLRPALVQKQLIETKNAQLQQIRENEARREAERELDRMWHDIMMKEIGVKMQREEQEAIERRNQGKDTLEVLNTQMKGKELMKVEMQRVTEEDRIEVEKLREQMRREEIEGLDAKRKQRDQVANELREQIAMQEQLLAKRREEENALDKALTHLANLEIEREKSKIVDSRQEAKREVMQYRENLKELERERKEEERILNELLDEHRKAIEKKQDEAKCKLKRARDQLNKMVLDGRSEQLKYKQQEAEEQLKLQQAENELMRMACERNERLEAEHSRMRAEAIQQYRDDLKKQIDYNEELRKREREELDRQLQAGLQEEERFKKLVDELIKGTVRAGVKHPFRGVLERYDCHCPKESHTGPILI